ncbi:MAG TPA: hypothetical protein PLJ84_00775 [Bacteroidales bacterium]|nr:hypothetical protein [Bacteroidales bacterium]HPT01104.1 hypothetical protein [Bacteroidales bacterium]
MATRQIDNKIILKEIENPINDLINLQTVYDKTKIATTKTELKTKYLNALILAANKSGLKLKK